MAAKTINDIVRAHLKIAPPPSGIDFLKRRRDFLRKTIDDLVRKHDAVELKIKEMEK